MISIEEAKDKIKANSKTLPNRKVLTSESLNYVLGEDLIAPMNLPGFRQSAMDGFALMINDLEKGIREFKLVAEVQAGPVQPLVFNSGEAVRIFTGAMVPECVDIVIIQEKCEYNESELKILEYSSNQKSNIRGIADQIEKGTVALEEGHVINPSSVGFLASLGITF